MSKKNGLPAKQNSRQKNEKELEKDGKTVLAKDKVKGCGLDDITKARIERSQDPLHIKDAKAVLDGL
jgi:hypothetical protein